MSNLFNPALSLTFKDFKLWFFASLFIGTVSHTRTGYAVNATLSLLVIDSQ